MWRRGVAVILLGLALVERATAVSFEEERELGRQFALEARAQLPLISDPDVVGYVEGVGQRVARMLEGSFFEYHFFVVRDAGINAFAVPGGYVYVHSGLLGRVANEDELAAVLAHEIGHVHAHHLARQMEATKLLNYATLVGLLASVVQPAVGALATAANTATQLSYQRQFEQEADYLGVRYIQAAGYDPHGVLDFFKTLADDQRSVPTAAAPYLRSHPVTDERLNHLEAVLRTQQWADHPRRPKSLALRRAQAVARIRSEPPADVVAAYRSAVAAAPNDPETRFLFGVVCMEAGEFEAARGALLAAGTAGVTAAGREMGRLALRTREPQAARAALRDAVAADPSDAAAWSELGKACELLGDTAAALDAYRRAVSIAPDLETTQYDLGNLAGRSGSEADGFFHLAAAARLRGEYGSALSQYTRAAGLLPAGDPRADEAREWTKTLSQFLHVRIPEIPARGAANGQGTPQSDSPGRP